MRTPKEIGKLIKIARKEAKLTQKELAKQMGLSRMMISRYEVGINNIPLVQLQKIAEILKKSLAYFLDDKTPVLLSPSELMQLVTSQLPVKATKIMEKVSNAYTKEVLEDWYNRKKLYKKLNKSFEVWFSTKIVIDLNQYRSTNLGENSSTDYTHK